MLMGIKTYQNSWEVCKILNYKKVINLLLLFWGTSGTPLHRTEPKKSLPAAKILFQIFTLGRVLLWTHLSEVLQKAVPLHSTIVWRTSPGYTSVSFLGRKTRNPSTCSSLDHCSWNMLVGVSSEFRLIWGRELLPGQVFLGFPVKATAWDCLGQSMDCTGLRVRELTQDKFLSSLSFPDRYWEPV